MQIVLALVNTNSPLTANEILESSTATAADMKIISEINNRPINQPTLASWPDHN